MSIDTDVIQTFFGGFPEAMNMVFHDDPASTSDSPRALAIVNVPVVATAFVAVCRQGGLWAVGRTADEAAKNAAAEIASCMNPDGRANVEGADQIVKFRSADLSRPIAEQVPDADECLIFYCTERVFSHMMSDGDGCPDWRAVSNVLDLSDEPSYSMLHSSAVSGVREWLGRIS